MNFEVGKDYITREGLKATLISDKSNDETYPLIFMITREDGRNTVEWYTNEGRWDTPGKCNLDIVGPWVEKSYINLFKDPYNFFVGTKIYNKKEDAEHNGQKIETYVKTIEIVV